MSNVRSCILPFGLAASLFCTSASHAADRVRFLTSWFAQAEHGGFYQAKAEGLYDKAGLDVTIKMGGAQVNGLQLLLAGDTDVLMGYDTQVLKGRERGLPLVTVAASFQNDLVGMMTHDDVAALGDLKGRPILIGTSSRTTFWPWLKKTYGFTDEQTRPYTFNLQPFFADPAAAQQGYLTSEPFAARQQGIKTKFFLFGASGYPPYGTTVVTTEGFVRDRPDVVARFVKASLEGWRDYLKDPAPANALIKADNPKMSDEQLAYAVGEMRGKRLVDGGDAEKFGIGIITEARWKRTFDFMVANDLLDAGTDWTAAYTDRFVKDLHVH